MIKRGNRDGFMRHNRRALYPRGRKPLVMAFVLYLLILVLFIGWRFGLSLRGEKEKVSVEFVNPNDDSIPHRTLVGPLSPQTERPNIKKKNAFVVVITNEGFVDGALVVGYSLMQQSAFAKDGTAELLLIFPVGRLSAESQQRLKCAGWQHVLQLPDLSVHAPNARLSDTFNKLHVFNLTQYSRVAVFDGDMLIIRNPDECFSTEIPNEQYIGAVGSRHHNYFQTGMMLIIPSTDTFLSLMKILLSDQNQQQESGRDGSIIRAHFQNRFVRLNHMLSIHISSHDEYRLSHAIGVHYRGSWKPWHNREDPPEPPAQPLRHHKSDPGQELGTPYRLWWTAYEQLHMQCMRRMDTAGSPHEYDPAESMWLMRHTVQSYQQPMRWVEMRQRNLSYVGQRLVRSAAGASCDKACVSHGPSLRCVEEALRFTSVNDAAALRHHFHCDTIALDDPAAHQPSYDTRTRRCHVNSLDGKRQRPTCAARDAHYRRLCACVDEGILRQHPKPQRVAGESNHNNTMESNHNNTMESNHNNTMESNHNNTMESNHNNTMESNHNNTMESNHKDTMESNGWEACAAWSPGGGNETLSRQCAARLAQWRFVTRVEPFPRRLEARTIKARLHYPNGVSALVKLEQVSFPLEPHAEYGAYIASLLLGVGLVPPTALLRVPRDALRQALLAAADEAEVQFLERELYWMRQRSIHHTGTASSVEETVVVSAQLWITGDVVPFANATPPLTSRQFDEWLRAGAHSTKIAKGHTHLMQDVASMVFFDYVIANDDRSFTHNAYIFMNRRVVLIDHGKSLCSTTDPEGNRITLSRRGPPDDASHKNSTEPEGAAGAPLMCRLPARLLRRALRLTRFHSRWASLAVLRVGKSGAKGRNELNGKLLRARPPGDGVWRIAEENIVATQWRLEQALDHFARCADVYGLSHVTGGSHS